MRLDFHSPCGQSPGTEIFGYGRAYYSILPELERAMEAEGLHCLAPAYSGGDVQIYFGVPFNEFKGYFERKSDRLWIFTMWESTIVAREVMENLQLFDGLIVPSEWCKTIFRENGYAGPVEVAPLGVAPGKWPFIERDPARTPFRVYWQGTSLADRKGAPETIRAFNQLNLPNSELWLKTNPRYTKSKFPFDLILPRPWIAEILKLILCYDEPKDIHVRVIGQTLDRDKMHELLGMMDLSVYPSRGEGFGLLPLEHMQSGLPAIVADNSGMSTYVNPDYMIPVSCTARCSTMGADFGLDYAADIDQLKEAILWAYNHRQESLDLGRKASKWVNETWTFAKTARRIIEIAEAANAGHS